ncbi:MAG: hypothetical protein ICV76_05705 [Nitrospiraceae bacterium]|nr:hypothetical protein [Nitrospiraceae bacterium]
MLKAAGDGTVDEGAPMIYLYAQAMGIGIILIGVVGLLLGEKPLLGVVNIDVVEDAVHLLTGGLMAFIGFTQSEHTIRNVVGGISAIYLLVGVLGFITPSLFGLLPHGYTAVDNIIHLALGVIGLGLAWPGRSRERVPHPGLS